MEEIEVSFKIINKQKELRISKEFNTQDQLNYSEDSFRNELSDGEIEILGEGEDKSGLKYKIQGEIELDQGTGLSKISFQ